MQLNFGKKNLTVITTHINADFDAMASMLAAHKLYPDSLVVFPGSHEKTLRNFFVQSLVYLFNMGNIKDIDFSEIRRLVLVDTRQPDRIGRFASVLERSDVEIHIYDHHPVLEADIRGHYEVIQPTGATVSILTEIIRERAIGVSPEEATIMCLGIYEDTGSFTFSSTTEKDFLAAAFLLSKGANLDIVSDLIVREIRPEQVRVLNDMIQNARTCHISGVDLVVTSITTDSYVADFAFLVHKMMKMENLNVIFALARMGSKIYVVARSRTPDADAGAVLRDMGGGGHAYAASASVKDETLAQTEQRLFGILYEKVRSSRRAKDLMSSPAITVEPGISCKDAGRLLTRSNINALMVTENTEKGRNRILGYITRQVVEKALYHGLEHVPVREYMTIELTSVTPDAELSEIQDKIIESKQRILPVVRESVIRGVITRKDLLNTLVREISYASRNTPDPLRQKVNARIRNIRRFMKERLSPRLLDILRAMGEVGDELGCGVYVVGGFVRDLFLYRPNEDIDIVVEGDGIAFARKYAAMQKVRTHVYGKFGTAMIIFPDDFKIDVATARVEYYRFPADLPTVEMSSIKMDLFRRDFTVNTLAIQLNPGKFGTLIDFFSAQKDIKEKVLRVLHNLSFVEDPTRVFRAIRFEQRFGFSIGKLTQGLIRNAVRMDFFRRLSGRRVFTELRLILEEENPTPAIQRLHHYDMLKIIHPSIKQDKKLIAWFKSVREVISWYDLLFLEDPYMRWMVYFLAMLRRSDEKISVEICEKLELSPRQRMIFCRERFEADATILWLRQHLPVKNSVLREKLSLCRTEMLLYMMAVAGRRRVKKAISHHITLLRHVTPSVTGKELRKMGLEPGPIYRDVLEAVLDAKLNGLLKTRNDELAFARNYVS
ncbi:MAG: polya polymerase [Desulfobacteraceae bacterium 4572_88]|nr:MAG: polya polymerase [Desulfobacteraceae bacterium 4572_88]